MSSERVDVVVAGAGVIGLAVARALAGQGREVLVLDGADAIGTGTSSRNSEVIHAGIYYPPGSLKAKACVEGRERIYRYCQERSIPHARCGKLIVGGAEAAPAIEALLANARACGVDDLRRIDADEIRALEPDVDATHGLLSPSTGIVDSHALMAAFHADIEAGGGMVVLRTPVRSARAETAGLVIETGGDSPMTLRARTFVNAAGLGAQALAQAVTHPHTTPIPERHLAIGHYYSLSGKSPFRHLVYPLPEPGGLGIHATIDLGGQARFGPDVRWIDTVDYAFDDSQRAAFVAAIRAYFPALNPDRLQPAYTGIRPKLSGPGAPPADFRIDAWGEAGPGRVVHLYGIESPGLTASMALADRVAALCAA